MNRKGKQLHERIHFHSLLISSLDMFHIKPFFQYRYENDYSCVVLLVLILHYMARRGNFHLNFSVHNIGASLSVVIL